jgi:hypothetical protein
LISIGVAALLLALLGWRLYERRYPNWNEEVQLVDGRVITIRQKREYFNDYGTNQSWVTIDLPELGGKRIWHSFLMPQRVDVYQGTVYAFGVPRGVSQHQFYKYPKHYLVAFKWDGAQFVRIPFLDVPDVLRRSENTYPCVPASLPSTLTVAAKERNWCPERGGEKWKFGRRINLGDYEALSLFYASLANQQPRSE